MGLSAIGQQGKELLVDLLVALPHHAWSPVQTDKQVEGRAKDRRRHDEDDPGHLGSSGPIAVVDEQHQQGCQQAHADGKPLSLRSEVELNDKDDCHLQENCYTGKNQTLDAILDFRLILNRSVIVHGASFYT